MLIWEQWKEAFEAYLDALEGESFTHKRKFAILRHCLGNEGRKILKYIPKVSVITAVGEGDGIEDEYETAIKSLDTRFKRCRNVTLERHQFYKRVQAEGGSASSYVGALRLLAVSCDYKDFEEEMIKDQLVEKTINKKVDGVRERRQVAQHKYVQSSHVTRRRKFDWKVGDVVRVRCPRYTSLSKFSSGKKIIQVGDSAVKLDDGKWWNKDKISLTKPDTARHIIGGGKCIERPGVQSPITTKLIKHTKRAIKPPKKFDDYIMHFGSHTSKTIDVPVRPYRRSSRTVKAPLRLDDYTC
ncbi:hypothetical protein NDU88_001731 [Pleurodeles waltl]|uniref:Uncharacterized protein n=1 Tax=Pleurodeles waltl TaxID=8319 RepID=A0AAV7MMJ5_PLEWA|nr:hypothetical protein NDU88_001731 [Pleurodeles waltl]